MPQVTHLYPEPDLERIVNSHSAAASRRREIAGIQRVCAAVLCMVSSALLVWAVSAIVADRAFVAVVTLLSSFAAFSAARSFDRESRR